MSPTGCQLLSKFANMEIIGYLAAGLIGVSLGLIGGGGSILTVPVLVYLFGVAPTTATSYSLFVVGITSLIGAYKSQRHHQVDKTAVIYFGITSVITVFLVRRFLLPLLPANLFTIGDYTITKSFVTMFLFAVLMILAAFYMIRNRKESASNQRLTKTSRLLSFGVLIGMVTGLLGAGGGFLLIPALIMLLTMPMKKAIGTSLTIISITSLFGFAVDLWQQSIEWSLLLPITGAALIGIIAGTRLNRNIDSSKLKKGFGWFVLTMGLFVLITQLLSIHKIMSIK